MKKLLVAIISGVVLVLLINHFLIKKLNNSSEKKPRRQNKNTEIMAVAVEAEPIKMGTLFDKGIFTGTLLSSSKFSLAPRISGRIRNLYVDIGDSISSGKTIAQLDNEELILAVKQAEANLEIAKANFNEASSLMEIAKKEYKRTETMRKQKVVSDVELEAAQSSYKTSVANKQVSIARLNNEIAALETAQIQLSYANVKANWSDSNNKRFVGERFLDEGAMTSPNIPIVTIIDIATLTAVIDVVEKDYFKIHVGQLASIAAAGIPDKSFPAKVTRIAPILDDSSRLARVELEISNSDFKLKPGMFVTTTVIFEEHKDTIIVPSSSIVRRQSQAGLFMVNEDNQTAKFVPIKIGISNANGVEILSPKLSGLVVTLGHHLLQDGAPLIVANITKDEVKNNVDVNNTENDR